MFTHRAGIPQRHQPELMTMTIPTGCTQLIVEERTDAPTDSRYTVHLQLTTSAYVDFDCHTREAAERLKAIIDTCRCVSFSAPAPKSSTVYRDAMQAQGACNLGALIHGWDRVINTLQAEMRAGNKGTDWLSTHPANVLFAEQTYHLTRRGSTYSEAYKECEDKETAG